MAQNAKITVHPKYQVGDISNRLFSAFMEPIGTIVNGTMFNPKHPTADEQGFRTDFIIELKNSYGNDTALMPEKEEKYTFENGEFKVYVKPLSWNVYVFEN